MARAILELITDATSLIRNLDKSDKAVLEFDANLKGLQVTAEKTANAQIRASARSTERQRLQIATYRQVAEAAQKGSREQVAAADLAARAEARLNRQMGLTTRAAHTRAAAVGRTSKTERTLGRDIRGGIAGSGLISGGGRALAFGSLGFLGGFGAARAVSQSITEGTKEAAVQRQLAAQFRASGQDLGLYRKEIEETTAATSRLAGFTKEELTRGFITAFRATKDVSVGLRIQAISADAARATGKDLQSITLGVTKAYLGQTAAAKRLGIIIPKNVKGVEALNYVGRRFAGQAAAGTTAEERFSSAIKNTEGIIGLALLPTFDKLLNKTSAWLSVEKNQREIQHKTNQGLRVAGGLVGALADAYDIAAAAAKGYQKVTKPFYDKRNVGGLSEVFKAILVPGYGLKLAAGLVSSLGGGGGSKVSQAPPGFARGTHGMGASTARNPGGFLTANQLIARGLDPSTYGKGPSTSANPSGFLPFRRASGKTGPRGTAGFNARFAVAELALARAQLTKAQADDKKILQVEAALLRERIKTLGTSRKTLADRTQLTQQLVGVEGQITSIETDAASKVTDARKKRLAAEQKAAREAYRLRTLALRNEAQRLAREKSADTKELATLKQRDRALASKIKQIQSNFKAALDTARQGVGDLFGGPVLNFSDEQRKAALGIPNTAADPKALVRDLRGQVQAEAARQRNINRIQKRLGLGRNSRLITELRSNTGDAAEVAGLAGADKGTLRAFAKQFAGRERLVQSIARADMRVGLANLHVAQLRLRTVRAQENHFTIYINDIEQKQAKVRVKQSAAQRRGPVPGRS